MSRQARIVCEVSSHWESATETQLQQALPVSRKPPPQQKSPDVSRREDVNCFHAQIPKKTTFQPRLD